MSGPNPHYSPDRLVQFASSIPPNIPVTISNTYVQAVAIFPIVLGCLTFIFAICLYLLVYGEATIRLYFPNFNCCGIPYDISCTKVEDHKRQYRYILLSSVLMFVVAGGLTVNFIPFTFTNDFYTSLQSIQVSIFSLYDLFSTLSSYTNKLDDYFDKYSHNRNDPFCDKAISYTSITNSIDDTASEVGGKVGIVNNLLNSVTKFIGSTRSSVVSLNKGFPYFVYGIMVLYASAFIVLVGAHFSRSRKYVAVGVVYGLCILGIVAIIYAIEVVIVVSGRIQSYLDKIQSVFFLHFLVLVYSL